MAHYKGVTDWTLAHIRAYYEQHAALMAQQLAGRRVRPYPPTESVEPVLIENPAELLSWTNNGVGGFLISPAPLPGSRLDRLVVSLTTGEGADIATAATVCLGLSEVLAVDGHIVMPAIDGQGGMLLIIPTAPIDGSAARAYLRAVLEKFGDRAPEIATTDPNRTDGRMLMSADASDAEVFSWAPYSLVPGASPGVVMPLHLDDVAAASAGMPLEIEPDDVADRLALRGDLTGALRSPSGPGEQA